MSAASARLGLERGRRRQRRQRSDARSRSSKSPFKNDRQKIDHSVAEHQIEVFECRLEFSGKVSVLGDNFASNK